MKKVFVYFNLFVLCGVFGATVQIESNGIKL